MRQSRTWERVTEFPYLVHIQSLPAAVSRQDWEEYKTGEEAVARQNELAEQGVHSQSYYEKVSIGIQSSPNMYKAPNQEQLNAVIKA